VCLESRTCWLAASALGTSLSRKLWSRKAANLRRGYFAPRSEIPRFRVKPLERTPPVGGRSWACPREDSGGIGRRTWACPWESEEAVGGRTRVLPMIGRRRSCRQTRACPRASVGEAQEDERGLAHGSRMERLRKANVGLPTGARRGSRRTIISAPAIELRRYGQGKAQERHT
jgi:hypothetical protein